ncbi:MAG: NADP-dependent malic enzyme [Melioribacteraceae bacterium]|nr:NADP-dependent malic enzyme [Melioribacteraceae bacterium]MCO6473115.1 NADP-dependent malic enzyme [Melioribacteraceae bacterium]
MAISKEEALRYHKEGRHGKIEVIATKPCYTSRDLSLAYTPGVAEPCREIHKNDDDVYSYTAKGNLVAVVSNGTAVLGLGNIGPHAGKPVMEGKGVLFKRFADIDVFDIELKTEDPKEVIKTVQLLEPTFGGINLEDIKAPECFEIEEELKKTMDIPIFHDDQHGTAIISCAALMNAVEIAKKKLEDIRIVVVGAGAAGIACSNLYVTAGVKRENICLFDSKGLIHKERKDLNKYKAAYAIDNIYEDLEAAMKGADVFVGLSKPDLLSKEMVASMAANPIIFAMANPDPEIRYEVAIEVRKDLIMATGRSDYPNQVNNVLGFPFIFRGALDVRAKAINEEMKLAAVKALADLAKEEVPEVVINAYGGTDFSFGPEYIIPKPFDPRVLWKVAPAVAKAAIESGVARKPIKDWKSYEEELQERLGFSKQITRLIVHKAQKNPKKIVYPEGEEEKIIRAAHYVKTDNIGNPVLLGNEEIIKSKIVEYGYDLSEYEIIDPKESELTQKYIDLFYEKRQRKGITRSAAVEALSHRNYFGAMMVECGDADSLIGGLTYHYPQTIRPALQCIGVKPGNTVVSGLYIIIIKRRVLFFADTTVNLDPSAEILAEVAISAADTVRQFDIIPKIAMLSFSNFGSVKHPLTSKVIKAVEIVKSQRPDLVIDGDMQADTAVEPKIATKEFPFSNIKGDANILIFPNLSSGNIAYKLLERLTDATVIGPILMGMKKPVHVLQRGASVNDIINMSAISVVEATVKS